MIAEGPVRQHLSVSVDGIDALDGGADLPDIDTMHRMNDGLMDTGECDIVISTHFLCQDILHSRVEKSHRAIHSPRGGHQIPTMSLPAGLREKMEYNEVPESFKGMPMALLTAGLMAIAFCGFSGLI